MGSGSAGEDTVPLPVTCAALAKPLPTVRDEASGSMVNKYQHSTEAAAAAVTPHHSSVRGFMCGGCAQGRGPQTDLNSVL